MGWMRCCGGAKKERHYIIKDGVLVDSITQVTLGWTFLGTQGSYYEMYGVNNQTNTLLLGSAINTADYKAVYLQGKEVSPNAYYLKMSTTQDMGGSYNPYSTIPDTETIVSVNIDNSNPTNYALLHGWAVSKLSIRNLWLEPR